MENPIHLSRDMWSQVIQCLNATDWRRLCATCRAMHKLCHVTLEMVQKNTVVYVAVCKANFSHGERQYLMLLEYPQDVFVTTEGAWGPWSILGNYSIFRTTLFDYFQRLRKYT